MPIKNILTPTDFSRNAQEAIDFILAFFKKREISLTLLNAYHIPVISNEMPAAIIYEAVEASKISSTERLRKLCDKITMSRPDIHCDFVVKQEPVALACGETVLEKNIDMVAMGTHGASGIKKMLFGSNAAHTVSSANCPVMVIPEKAKFWKMKKMLFATDYYSSDAEDIVSLSELAGGFDAEIIVVHISDGREADNDAMRKFEGLVKKKCRYEKISFFLLGKSDIIKALDYFIEQNEIELLAMSTRERSPFEKLFSPSITKKMAYHTTIPLLAFHCTADKVQKNH